MATRKSKAVPATISLTMSSREIAELTGKEHFIVMRDIRSMLIELYGEGGEYKFVCSYLSEQNKRLPEYHLPKRETLVLISGYNTQFRAKIIDRWQELEAKATTPQPELSDWEKTRAEGKIIRKDFTGTLKSHGVTGNGYAQCTNSTYKGLYGKTAAELRAEHGLAKTANVRDYMSEIALAATKLAELVTTHYIEKDNIVGNLPCATTCHEVGEKVSVALPEGLPAIEAQKKLH